MIDHGELLVLWQRFNEAMQLKKWRLAAVHLDAIEKLTGIDRRRLLKSVP